MHPFTVHCYFDLSGRRDLNPGPPAPEAGALTGLRYAPYYNKQRKREKKSVSGERDGSMVA